MEEGGISDIQLANELQTQEMIINQLSDENIRLLSQNKDYRSQQALSLLQTKTGFHDTQQEFRRGDPRVDVSSLQKISTSYRVLI
jgi:hypothetical protein